MRARHHRARVLGYTPAPTAARASAGERERAMRIQAVGAALFVNVVALGCGGGGGDRDPEPGPPRVFSVTVSGLEGSGFDVWNGHGHLWVPGNGTFTFEQQIDDGARYDLEIGSSTSPIPSGVIRCTAGAAATGVATADVNVPITCTTIAVFTAVFGGDRELWATDGSRSWRVANINPGGSSNPEGMTALNGRVYFTADDGAHGVELWMTDGRGAYLVRDIVWESALGSYPGEPLVVFRGELYFAADDPYWPRRALWKTDGTWEGTVELKSVHEVAWPREFGVIGEGLEQELYFSGWTEAEGLELWRSDGTASGTVFVADVCPGTCDSGPGDFVELGGWVYFIARCEDRADRLWRTDGTTTELVTGYGDARAYSPTRFGDEIYFEVMSGTESRLWKTDGTAEGTRMVTTPDMLDGFRYPSLFGVLDGTLFFQTDDGTSLSVWKIAEGETAPVLVKSSMLEETWYCFGPTVPFTPYHGEVYFKGTDSTHGCELWKSDGTEGGTTMLADLNPDGDGAAFDLTIVNGRLLFGARASGTTPEPGARLWATDGSAAGTSVIADVKFCGFTGAGC